MKYIYLAAITLLALPYGLQSQDLPRILQDKRVMQAHYMPDYSYAGYHFGERKIPDQQDDVRVLNALDYGVVPDDLLDDSKALLRVMEAAHKSDEPVVVQLPPGHIILSEIIYIERSHLVLRGAGSGAGGTVIYCPRPMKYLSDPPALAELREYLIALDKRQREPKNNIDLPYSQYAWSGGMIWTRYPGVRTKAYLEKYDQPPTILTRLEAGKRGEHLLTVNSADRLREGDVVQIEWYNTEGEDGSLIRSMYDDANVKIGSHHWQYPSHSLVQQQVKITSIRGNRVTIKDPLLHDIRKPWQPAMVEWKHLEEVGIEHLRIEFPMAPNIAHHIEEGYNAIYLTRLFNGWVRDVSIGNADSGVLTEEVANVTVQNVETWGNKLAHYSVSMSGVHNVLVENLRVKNGVRHPLSFNTFSTRSVYRDCEVEIDPILDQHSGANHQNLFDHIVVHVALEGKHEYPLFAGGGAGYWKPSHGAYTTFWNVKVNLLDGFDHSKPVVLNGMTDGPSARLIGIHANRKIEIGYGPDAYIEAENVHLEQIPSLYKWQLAKRLGTDKK